MVYVFGLNIPILELLVIFGVVVVAYLVLLEIEVRQMRKLLRRFESDEELLEKKLGIKAKKEE